MPSYNMNIIWSQLCLMCLLISSVFFLVIMISVDPNHEQLYENILILFIIMYTISFISYVMSSFYTENDIIVQEEV